MPGINLVLKNSPTITEINCGTSSPKLSGSINISQFSNLTGFTCINNDITNLSGVGNCSSLKLLNIANNKLTGSIPNLSSNILLETFICGDNKLTGPIPSYLPTISNLKIFFCYSNLLTGNIPNFNSDIESVSIHNNQFTGPMPNLSTYSKLNLFHCFQTFQLTGTIPNLPSTMKDFRCQVNQLSGSIPNISNTVLIEFSCDNNQLTGFAGGSIPNTLNNFYANNNQLTSSTVNSLLSAFVAAGRTGSGVLNLGGTTNFRPTGQGVIDVTTLRNRGWTVTTGTRVL
jgi:hypothetical protein